MLIVLDLISIDVNWKSSMLTLLFLAYNEKSLYERFCFTCRVRTLWCATLSRVFLSFLIFSWFSSSGKDARVCGSGWTSLLSPNTLWPETNCLIKCTCYWEINYFFENGRNCFFLLFYLHMLTKINTVFISNYYFWKHCSWE